MRKTSGSAKYTDGGHIMPDCGDPLRGLAVLAVERVGLRLPTRDHAREVAVVHASGAVHRWLCSSETRWRRSPPDREGTVPESKCRLERPDSGWGLDPAEVVAGLSPVLERSKVLAIEPEAVTWWLTTLYGFVSQPVPCRVRPLDDLYRELLPGTERIRVVTNARHLAARLHPEAPHLVTEATHAIESLRQIAYRLEVD